MKLLIIVTPNFNMNATAAFIDPFRAANYLDGVPHFSWTIASVDRGLCVASNAMVMETEALDTVRHEPFDLVIVSSSWTPETYASKPLETALRHWARQGCMVGALDTGAFILAKAGLLKDRRATVHYEHIDAMHELYPDVETSEDLFVFDGNRISCCGGSAAGDFALHIIKNMLGEGLANRSARYVFHQSLRPPGTQQNPDPVEPLGSTAPAVVKRAIKLMEQNLEEPVPIKEVCRQVNISQRQLNRLFSTHVRKRPALYYRDIRLDRARGLVTQTDMPLSEVAIASGFSSQVHFSRAYRERFGLPPRNDRVEGRVPFEYRAWPMHRKKESNPSRRPS